ncbi:MAG: TrkA-C domain protein [Acidobacteria bacterium]|nr:TrkA-C domain protein [Acidobacteriota bacterium]
MVVLSILVAAVIFFITEKFRPDLVALLVVSALLLGKVLSITDALAGFSNPAVITIAAIFVVTAGLTNTGVAVWFGRFLFQAAGRSETRLIALTMGASAMLSLVMNNIASASVLLPGLNSVARRTKVSPSKLMIPLSFGTLLGGMATLFTTVNLLANDALHKGGLIPFSLWDYFRIGSILLLAGVLFMVIAGRKLLPNHPAKERMRINRFAGDLVKLYHLPDMLFEANVPAGSLLDGKTVSESRLGSDFNLNVIGIIRGRKLKLAPEANDVLLAGDGLLIEGEQKLFQEAKQQVGLGIESNGSASYLRLSDQRVGIVEVLISPHAGVVGRSLREIHFRQKFGTAALAILREGVPILRGVPDLPLRFGDTLLVQGPRRRIQLLNEERDFIVLEDPGYLGEIGRPDKAPWALAGMGIMLFIAAFGILPIAAAALIGALIMVLSGALKIDEGYQAIEWKAVVMVAGMLSLGTALQKSGTADLISHHLLHLLEPMGQMAVLAGFFLVSLLLAQVLSGVATTVLIVPIALSTATQLHVSAYPLVMAVVLGASSGFLTPVSHPVNVLVMGPGGYRFSDFGRVGIFLALIVFVLVMILVPRFWPL